MVLNFSQEIVRPTVLQSQESSDHLRSERDITPLHDLRLFGGGFDSDILLLQSQACCVRGISVFHPVDRELIAETGSDMLALNYIVRRAVLGPRRLGRACSGNCIN